MSHLTLNLQEIRERWMRLYVNLHVLKSTNPKVDEVLKAFKDKISVMNEEFMAFFDALEKIVEAEG